MLLTSAKSSRTRKPHRHRVVGSLSVCLMSLATSLGTADQPSGDSVPVEIAIVGRQHVAPSTWIPGSIMSLNDARLASVVAGRVVSVAEVGQHIAAGAPVAKLDDTLAVLRVHDLEAQLARARAQQALLRVTLERYQKLAATSALSASQLDEAKTQFDMASDDIARLTAQLNQAKYESSESELRAPFAGIVAERFLQRGEFVQIGAPVVRLVDTRNTEARATVPLDLAANISVGQPLSIRAQGIERRGDVRTVVPIGDERSHQIELRATPQDSNWMVGTPVELSVPTAPDQVMLTVPRDALVLRKDRTYVMKVNGASRVEQVEVSVGNVLVGLVAVKGKLAPGDRLVVRGAERLAHGQHVTVMR